MKSWMRFALCLFLSSAALFSQSYKGQGRMTGVVTDQAGKPLEGVKVKLFSLKGK